jgi:RHS repeat-associated protein
VAEATVVNGQPVAKATYLRRNQLIARFAADGTKSYYQFNGHGDVTELRDAAGNVQTSYSYDIWGNPIQETQTVDNPFRYSGEYWDKTTALLNLRARWYDPDMGRFLNEDTGQGDLKNPQSENLYTYVENNPLTHSDPSGHWLVDVLFLVMDVASFAVHPTFAGAGWIAADVVSFGDPTGGVTTMMHTSRAIHATTETIRATERVGEGVHALREAEHAVDVGKAAKVEKNYQRPSGFRSGVKDKTWENAKGPNGEVRDPVSNKVMNKSEPWDMGHKPGYEFSKHQQSAKERGITRKQFLNEHNNPSHYRPELPSSNRSHKGEDRTGKYLGY